ncbi:MAG: hypothetical protein JWO50_759 [Candidatus Kaiserbacteria bacterium]|nr:hypothetical protein [Candidatus Kaiserbacteria bacterium]
MSFQISKSRKELLKQKVLRIRKVIDKNKAESFEVYELVLDVVYLIEQVLKIKLVEKNPLLIYDKIPSGNDLVNAVEGKAAENENTVLVGKALLLYRMFNSDSEIAKTQLKVFEVLFLYRNELYHNVLPFTSVKPITLIKLSREAFNALLPELNTILGKVEKLKSTDDGISKDEVVALFRESVKRKISIGKFVPYRFGAFSMFEPQDDFIYAFGNNKCPRCGSYTLKEESAVTAWRWQEGIVSPYFACSKCHLELTPEEYEEAKKIMREEAGD